VNARALAAAGGALWLLYLALALRGEGPLLAMPIAEDGWYALSVARNVARGLGVTIDGTVWTNGFQPLFTFLEAAAFALAGGDTVGGVRAFFVLAALVHGAGALLVASLARDAWDGARDERTLAAALAFVGYLASVKAYNDFYTGLETGLQLALYAGVWRLYTRDWRNLPGDRIAMGVLLGMLVLARIDAAVFVAVFCAAELWFGRAALGAAIARCFVVGGSAVIVSLPWWLYNWLMFGHPMPISGFAQQAVEVSIERTMTALWALQVAAMPWIFAGAYEAWWTDALRLVALAGILAAFVFVRRGQLVGALERESRNFALMLLAAYAALVGYYWLTFFADWFYIRYFDPLSLLAFVFVPAVLARAIRRVAAPLGLAFAAFTAVLLVLAWRGEGLFGHSAHGVQVAMVEAHVPAGAVVAAGQSGTLGFMRANVVNVDGKVNAEALKWRGRMWEYLDARGIEWFVDSTWYVELYLGLEPETHGWHKTAQEGDFVVYRRAR
jgi:hypothetical protein